MANFAIKGHATRGDEVIEILEMMGGVNAHNLYGDKNYAYYTIDSDKEIKGGIYIFGNEDLLSFTIEEFEEKFPYKVGDKVQHKGATSCGPVFEVEKMRWKEDTVKYTLCLFGCNYKRSTLPAEYLKPYKEAPMYLNEKANKKVEEIAEILEPVKEIMEEIKLDIPDGYEFFGVDDDNKIVLTKKQPQYPKTYEECCDIIEYPHNVVGGYKAELLSSFQNLLICRDAYWKIAGEQMRLGKPWKPQFENCSIPHYCIFINHTGEIYNDCFYGSRCLLAFPTKEMRDAFYENFKNAIETCKELL